MYFWHFLLRCKLPIVPAPFLPSFISPDFFTVPPRTFLSISAPNWVSRGFPRFGTLWNLREKTKQQQQQKEFISSAPDPWLPRNPLRRCKPWGPGPALGPSHPVTGSPGAGASSSPLSAAPVPAFRRSWGTGREGAPEWVWGFEWESRLWRRRPILSCPSLGIYRLVCRRVLLGGFSAPPQGFGVGVTGTK